MSRPIARIRPFFWLTGCPVVGLGGAVVEGVGRDLRSPPLRWLLVVVVVDRPPPHSLSRSTYVALASSRAAPKSGAVPLGSAALFGAVGDALSLPLSGGARL